MKSIMLLLSLAASIFRYPDQGGSTGADANSTATDGDGKTVQDIAKENAELSARAAELGIEVPAFPAGPAGLAKAREFMKAEIAKREGEQQSATAAEVDPDTLTGDELRELEEQEDADYDSEGTDEQVRAAILDNRRAKKEAQEQSKAGDPGAGTSGSPQSGDANS